jgi:hypothetical protein
VSDVLTLRVEYNLDGASPDYLKDQLKMIARAALNQGHVTGNCPATVESHYVSVTEIEHLTEDEHSFTVGAVCDEMMSNGDFRWQVGEAWVAPNPQFHHNYWKDREDEMEKYGQKTENGGELEKNASGDVLCPECGAKCEKHGNTIICPTHGTKPFAKKPTDG